MHAVGAGFTADARARRAPPLTPVKRFDIYSLQQDMDASNCHFLSPRPCVKSGEILGDAFLNCGSRFSSTRTSIEP